jgi:hypothetical protein
MGTRRIFYIFYSRDALFSDFNRRGFLARPER